jgi:acid phosphatase type 7
MYRSIRLLALSGGVLLGGCSGETASPTPDEGQVPFTDGFSLPDWKNVIDGQPSTGDRGSVRSDGSIKDGPTSPPPFRFISWGDTKSATSVLTALSNQAIALKPAFSLYSGDMVSTWSDSAMDTWKNAIDGGKANGLFQNTFTVRGNHDATSSSGYLNWMAAHHPLAKAASSLGAKSYSDMAGKASQVYSFDYGNAHFVGLDSTGDADTIGSDQITWLDGDLAAAQGRGLAHAFLFFHGPIYCVAEHCDCKTNICKSGIYKLVTVLNKYPFVSATFHGHEHVYAYTLLDNKRDAKITHPFHQFVTGDAGAGPDVCDNGRYDYWMNSHGFLVVDVAGKQVSASFYKQGNTTPQKTITWSM